MKCTIPEISWHNRGPVLSVDIQVGTCKSPAGESFWRLASGGADSHVLIWHVTLNEAGEAIVSCVADLERHQRTVNVVRFSPSGEILASGDDESAIILWKQREGLEIPLVSGDDIQNKEQWNSWKVLRGHIEDIYDLSWSPDSNLLVSGSLDNSVILWNVQKGKKISMLTDYTKGFPQGVTWDPANKYIATISSDRLCRLIDVNTKKTVQRIGKSKMPTAAGHPLEGKVVRLFYDDTFKSFFRRLTFTPDGSLLIVPSGIIEPQESTEKIANCTVVFSRYNLKEPVAILPSLDEVTNAVRCCPVYFELRDDGPTSMIALPYRIIFAVATDNSVIIYDTQQIAPIAVISNIHYTRLTDITWSSDGRLLIASSSDGYCSIINFQEGQLGKIYKITEETCRVEAKDEVREDKNDKTLLTPAPFIELDVNAVDIDILQQKNIDNDNNEKAGKMDVENTKNVQDTDETEDFQLVLEDTVAENLKPNVKATPPKTEKPPTMISARTPRRVQLITLSSPKRTKTE
ncbi:PREDICTED: chromatin assembly factor 1 subunit B [Ceratosolen solmsi marchali]|uniref:Chromatin assembly factor 1 subunit B n=1 Tax=Ceratosolen solmsi marchali TaxID=326594 RepID=A0AAJ6YKN7_9HYME|nr:PREDICTED: chromatin assembly factor 1 subunit B [Ceratosolen solmsi marchali]